MNQKAPDPDALRCLVERLDYKAGWRFTLEDVERGQGSEGLTLCALATVPDSYHPERDTRVMHYFPVPPAAYHRLSGLVIHVLRVAADVDSLRLELEAAQAAADLYLDGGTGA